MGLHPATDADIPALVDYLRGHAATAMFALSNLVNEGLGSDGPRQMRFWLSRAQGRITGAIGLSGQGFLLPVMPYACADDWQAAVAAVRGLAISGVAGETGQADRFMALAGLTGAVMARSEDEPGFTLVLSDLKVPDCAGYTLLRPGRPQRATLLHWRAAYHAEVLGTPADQAEAQGAADIDGYLARDSHRLLLHGGQPVAMTGFNATLPDRVQIGGVYTPPALRGQGHARRAVALHLAEARGQGVAHAVLYAFSDQAARAYRAIGFQPAGRMRLAIFAQMQVVAP
jgi:RimJ/RimL family protein N-acetyltransferase